MGEGSVKPYESIYPGDLQANNGRQAKRRKITEPPVIQSIETDGGDHLVAMSNTTGKVDCPTAADHNAISQANLDVGVTTPAASSYKALTRRYP